MIRATAFSPAWWLPGPHSQTVWASLCRRKPRLLLRRERLELADGDFIDLDWTTKRGFGPLVLVLHGLEGSSDSGYTRGMLQTIEARGWRAVVMHFRNCSGEPNRLRHSYHAGATADIDSVLNHLRRRAPEAPPKIACVGYSLGGNVLLKWLGEQGQQAAIQAAVAVSVPFLLDAAAQRMNQGLSRLYQWYLLQAMRRNYRRKFKNRHDAPVGLGALNRLRDFYRFDDQITAPLHGYVDVHDYYAQASCRPYLPHISTPTLILHANDDPFMLASAIPTAHELSASTILELSRCGGHVGFVSGRIPGLGQYWLDQRITDFLSLSFN